MANVQIANTDAQLTGSLLDSIGAVSVSVSLTNAQIKALPTTPVEIIPAVSGKIFIPLAILLNSTFASGAYTNIGVVDPYFQLMTDNGSGENWSDFIEDIPADSITNFSTFMSAINSIAIMGPFRQISTTYNYTITQSSLTSKSKGKNVSLNCGNDGAGNFTGGNAANSLVVKAYYIPVTV